VSPELFTLINTGAMTVVVWIIPLSFIPFFIWLERKGSAIIQDRVGPDRTNILGVRLLGYIQNFADTLKLLMKENLTPGRANGFYFLLAPFWSMTIALLPLLVIPLAAPMDLFGHTIRFQAANFDFGALYLFAITSMGVFGIILAGWSSNNKFALLGGLRSSSQMISYELSMGLALVSLVMVYQGVRMDGIVETQGNNLTFFGLHLPLPGWGIFLQPVAFLLFLVSGFAETNRNPFDLAEGESELVAGYHVEYSSVKFALFFMAEYVNMAVVAFILSTLFLGGYQVPFASTPVLQSHPNLALGLWGAILFIGGGVAGFLLYRRAEAQKYRYQGVKKWEPYFLAGAACLKALLGLAALIWGLSGMALPGVLAAFIVPILQFTCLILKVFFFCWLFVWVRWTLPRFRYDQLMRLGWRIMLPLAMLNLLVTGLLILAQRGNP
jgi:NADH-quinone oxidoreductase subunit H